jgi:succinate dehydrogenase membrane anchor subunit
MSMRTPLGRVTGLGSAKDGTAHFWRIRLTAAANVPLVVFLLWLVLAHAGATRDELAAVFANPLTAAAAVLAIFSVCWHMLLGMQVVIEDYVESDAIKVVLLALNAFFAVAVGTISAVSVMLLAVGG